jgi:hypothetical protein
MKGLVFGLAAVACLGLARSASADIPGEALQESHYLEKLEKSHHIRLRANLGGSWLNRHFDGETVNTTNVELGLNGYYKNWFVRADGNLSVDDDHLFNTNVETHAYSGAVGYQHRFCGCLVGGAWIGYSNLDTDLTSDFSDGEDFDDGMRGPLFGLGLNYTIGGPNHPSRWSVFGGGRYLFAQDESSGFHRLGISANDGFELGLGFRYQVNKAWNVDLGATYRRLSVDTPVGNRSIEDIQPRLVVGYNF